MSVMDQRHAALARANTIRCDRAHIRETIRGMSSADGRQYAAGLVDDPPECCESWWVEPFLMSVRGIGRVVACRILFAAAISPRARLRHLTVRQRIAISAALRGDA